MFGNLFGKKDKTPDGPAFSYITYMSTAAKFRACADLAKTDPSVHFIAWFPDTAAKLKSAFSGLGIDTSRVHEARSFHSGMAGESQLVIAEPYPLHEKEKALVQHWRQAEVTVYCGLDEPFFDRFGSDRIIGMMQKLGMKEDEPLQHKLISQSIINAQKKIATKVQLEQSASSQQEWMEKNLR